MKNDLTLQEQENALKAKQIFNNSVVLSNIIELSVSVISRIAGKNISDTIDNQTLNRTILSNLVASRVKEVVLK